MNGRAAKRIRRATWAHREALGVKVTGNESHRETYNRLKREYRSRPYHKRTVELKFLGKIDTSHFAANMRRPDEWERTMKHEPDTAPKAMTRKIQFKESFYDDHGPFKYKEDK